MTENSTHVRFYPVILEKGFPSTFCMNRDLFKTLINIYLFLLIENWDSVPTTHIYDKVILPLLALMYETVISSHCVHLKLGHRFNALLKVCSDHNASVPLSSCKSCYHPPPLVRDISDDFFLSRLSPQQCFSSLSPPPHHSAILNVLIFCYCGNQSANNWLLHPQKMMSSLRPCTGHTAKRKVCIV